MKTLNAASTADVAQKHVGFRPDLARARHRWYLAVLALLPALVLAEDESTPEDTTSESQWNLATDQMFHRRAPRPFVRYPEDVYDYLQASGGLYLQFASTTVYQAADSSRTDRKDLLSTNLDFVGGWQISEDSGVSWWVRSGRPIGDARDANLSTDIGSILDINASLENQDLHLREAYWAGGIAETVRISLGITDTSYRYDFNAVANDEGCCFLSVALVNSLAIPLPEPGLSVDALWEFGPSTSIHAGIYQNNCTGDEFACIDNLDTDRLFVPIEIIQKVNIRGLGSGTYRLLAFHNSAEGKRGTGFSISIDQEIGRFRPFLRYGRSEQGVAEIDHFFSAGTDFAAPFGREWDAIGIAFARGRPSDRNLETETIIETYWRFQVNPMVSLSPILQVVIDPANNPARDRIMILGARLQIEL